MDMFTFIKETEGLEESLEFAINHGLIPDKSPRTCMHCGRQESLRWAERSKVESVTVPFVFTCAEKECRYTFSVTRNTLFDHISFSLSQALRLIYFWLLKIPVMETSNQLQLSESTVTEWFQFFREVCAYIIINYTKAIGGPSHTVELSEYHLYTNEDIYDVWIFTGVDRHTGQNFAIHVSDLDCETLWPVIKNYILPGTVVVTEKYCEYTKKENKLKSKSLKFVHPNQNPRMERHFHLDEMWDALKDYVDCETLSEQQLCRELYAYQYLYFNRDEFYNKPASELILPFLNDVKQVYPGFKRDTEHVTVKVE